MPAPDAADPLTGLRRALVALLVAPFAYVAALPILVLGVPFWAVGALTRALVAALRRLEPRAVPWQDLMMFEPDVGWMPRPHVDVLAEHEVRFRLTTDGRGWRDRTTSLEDAELVVVGDSFAFGLAIDDADFFGRRVRVPVKAVGAPAYSMVHGYLWMERLGEALRDKLVVWFVYYGNDPYENLRPNHGPYRMPFLRQRQDPATTPTWEIATAHVRSEPWPVNAPRAYLDRLAELCAPGPLAERAYSGCAYLIGQAAALNERLGSRLIVVGVPDAIQLSAAGVEDLTRRLTGPAPVDPHAPDRTLGEICRRLDIPFVALADHVGVDDYYRFDCHWNASGHARVARVLDDLHRTHFPFGQGRVRDRAPSAHPALDTAPRTVP